MAREALHVPEQPQGLLTPVIGPHPMSLQAHLFLVPLACPGAAAFAEGWLPGSQVKW